jgi:hypothetical protein
MLSFYVVRKLLEAGKASPQIVGLSVPVLEFARRAIAKGAVDAPILQAHYDLEHPVSSKRDLKFICHQIVHSFVFSVAVGYQSGLAGVYFASDFQRNKGLFFISAAALVRLLQKIGLDARVDRGGWVEERLREHRVQTAFPPRDYRAVTANPRFEGTPSGAPQA